MRTDKKKLLLGAAALVLLGYILYRSRGVLHLGDFSGGKLWAAIRSANPLYILLGVALIYVCFALRSLRWQIFQKNLGKAEFWSIYRMTLAGFAAVFVLGRAAEPVRPLLLSRKGKIPVADTFGIYVLERLFDFASSAVIAALGLLLYASQEHLGGASSAIGKGARTAGGLLAAGAVFLSVIHWYFVALVYLFVSHGFGGRMALLTVGDCLLLLAITLVGSILQLPTVGGGAQALAIFAYTQVFGVEKEAAVAAALVLWLVTFASCSIAGIPFLIREGFSFGQLREMAEHEKE